MWASIVKTHPERFVLGNTPLFNLLILATHPRLYPLMPFVSAIDGNLGTAATART